jgi:hypothetical protein
MEGIKMTNLYFVQNSRKYVGNSVLWWREDGTGYTTNLAEAMIVDDQWVGRNTDILWSCDKVKKYATVQLDMQQLRFIK